VPEGNGAASGDIARGDRIDGSAPRLTARPATLADVRARYPDHTASFRAWVFELDGEPKGIVGIALYRPVSTLFSAFDEELRPHLPRPTVMRVVKKLQRLCERYPRPVVATAEPGEPTAPGLLRKLGFHLVDNIDGEDVYRFGVTDG
jgi:hypothetical protein